MGSKVSYGPLAAVVVTVALYFVTQLAVGVLLAIGATLLGVESDEISSRLDESIWAQFAAGILYSAIILGLLQLFLKRRPGVSWSSLGWVKLQKRDIPLGLAAFGVYFVIILMVMTILPQLWPSIDAEQQQEIGFAVTTTGPSLILVFAGLVLLPAFVEETLVRGFLYTGLRTKLALWPAALLTSALFGIAHLQLNEGQAPLWVAVIDTFVLSMVLVYLRERTGSLWSPTLVHFMKNSLAFIFLFVLRWL